LGKAEHQLEQEDPGQAPQPNSRALSKLFEQHNKSLVSLLAYRLQNEAEAKEVAQEAYVRLLQLDQPRTLSFLRAWLFKIAINIAIDRLRHRRRAERLDESFEADDLVSYVEPNRVALAREDLGVFQQALAELPEAYRKAFLMSRLGEKSTEDIAATLGLKNTQTRLYIRRAMSYCRLRINGFTAQDARQQVFT